MTTHASDPLVLPAGTARRQRVAVTLDEIAATMVSVVALGPLVYLSWRAVLGSESALAALVHTRTLTLIGTSLALAATVAFSATLVALPLAWLTERVAVPGRRIWATLFALPMAVPSYLAAYAVVATLGPRGALASVLERTVGLTRLPEIYGFFGAWLTLTLVTYPYVYLALRASIRGLDPAFEEAARTLGHGRLDTLWKVILPLLRPGLVSGMLLTALYVLSDFGAIAILRYPTLTYSIYNQYRLSFDRAAASALALLLVALTAVLVVAERQWRRRAAFFRTSGTSRTTPLTEPRPWSWFVLVLGLSVSGLALAMPAGIAAYWWWRAWTIGEEVPDVRGPFVNSVAVSLAAAIITVAIAFPVARAVVRGAHRLTRTIDLPLWIAYGLPGIVLALALVSLTAQVVPWLYQTLPLLLIGYALRFLPEAVGLVRAVLAQQSPRLEEAARTLGLRPWHVWLRVQFPLTLPGLVSAVLLVFLTTVKELPVTLLLSPIEFTTLATTVWNATTDAYWS
ncbi:MAG: iron ABC transporter permease, partial [Thermomicrobium sp.]|nr:iron ABC transporter permease [Thermomicrobium sp.]